MSRPDRAVAAIALILALSPLGALADDLIYYEEAQEATAALMTPILANEMDRVREVLEQHFDEGGADVVMGIIEQFLSEDETFNYHDVVLHEQHGDTLLREVHAVGTTKDDHLFLELFLVRGAKGWVIRHMNLNSDVQEFFSDWVGI